jgi:hypothetical protein
MTIRPRAARNIRELRSRLRDLAAASHAERLAARDRQRDVVAEHEVRLETHLDTAPHVLAEATSVHDLELVHEDTGVYRFAIAEARSRLDEVTKETVISEAALRERARQLRAAERLVETLERGISRREAAAEQRAHDDLSARRR